MPIHTQSYTQSYPIYPIITDNTRSHPIIPDHTRSYPLIPDHTLPYPIIPDHTVVCLNLRCSSDGGVHRLPAAVGSTDGACVGPDSSESGGKAWGGDGDTPRRRVPDSLQPPLRAAAVVHDGDRHHRERHPGGLGVRHRPTDFVWHPFVGGMSLDRWVDAAGTGGWGWGVFRLALDDKFGESLLMRLR